MPLDITILILQRPSSDLEQSHRHSRPDLCQFDALEARLHKYMMAYLNAIFDILERDDSVPDLLREFPRWEDMLEDLHNTLAEWGVEIVKNEVWIGFGDCAASSVWDVGAKYNVVEGEGGCRSVG